MINCIFEGTAVCFPAYWITASPSLAKVCGCCVYPEVEEKSHSALWSLTSNRRRRRINSCLRSLRLKVQDLSCRVRKKKKKNSVNIGVWKRNSVLLPGMELIKSMLFGSELSRFYLILADWVLLLPWLSECLNKFLRAEVCLCFHSPRRHTASWCPFLGMNVSSVCQRQQGRRVCRGFVFIKRLNRTTPGSVVSDGPLFKKKGGGSGDLFFWLSRSDKIFLFFFFLLVLFNWIWVLWSNICT